MMQINSNQQSFLKKEEGEKDAWLRLQIYLTFSILKRIICKKKKNERGPALWCIKLSPYGHQFKPWLLHF